MSGAGRLTRRAALAGAVTSTAVLAAPRVALAGGGPVVAASDDISAKVERLCMELSRALDDFNRGTFRAIIEPDSHSRMPVLLSNLRLARRDDALLGYLKNATPGSLASYHAMEFAKILRQQRGGSWMVTDFRGIPNPGTETAPDVVTFVQHPGGKGVGVPAFDFGPAAGAPS